jgi:hypothetical protein
LAFLKLFAVAHAKNIKKLTIAKERSAVSTHIILFDVGSHMKTAPNAIRSHATRYGFVSLINGLRLGTLTESWPHLILQQKLKLQLIKLMIQLEV